LQSLKGPLSRVVFVHGAGESHKIWTYQAARFKDCVAIDLPGHPDGKGEKTIEGYAAFVDDLLIQGKLHDVVLVGHSMGGAIVLELALRAPSYVKGIVLVATGARLRVTPRILEGIKADYMKTTKLIVDYALSPAAPDWLRKTALNELQLVRPEVVLGDFEACDKFDRMREVQRIGLPTLIICGSEDKLTPVKYSEYLNRNISGSRLVVIRGAGHMVTIERPDQVNDEIEMFLNCLAKA